MRPSQSIKEQRERADARRKRDGTFYAATGMVDILTVTKSTAKLSAVLKAAMRNGGTLGDTPMAAFAESDLVRLRTTIYEYLKGRHHDTNNGMDT